MAYRQEPGRAKSTAFSNLSGRGLINPDTGKKTAKKRSKGGKKFLTTQYDKPGSTETFHTTTGEDVSKHQMITDQTKGIKQTNTTTGEVTHVDRKDTDLPEAKVTDLGTTEIKGKSTTTKTGGDTKQRAERTFEAHKLVKDPGGASGTGYSLREKASVDITNKPYKDYSTGKVDEGQTYTFRKYGKGGEVRKEKEFKVKGDAGKNVKGVKERSRAQLEKKYERVVGKYNRKTGQGGSNLAYGGDEKSSMGTDKSSRKQTFINKKEEAERKGHTGYKQRKR